MSYYGRNKKTIYLRAYSKDGQSSKFIPAGHLLLERSRWGGDAQDIVIALPENASEDLEDLKEFLAEFKPNSIRLGSVQYTVMPANAAKELETLKAEKKKLDHRRAADHERKLRWKAKQKRGK